MIPASPSATMLPRLVAVLVCWFPVQAQDSPPLVPGTLRNHGLEPAQVGRVLLQELRCTACHADGSIEAPPAPDLARAGARIRPDYLRSFLADPGSTRAGSCMPDVLGGEPEEVTTALVHYLVSRAGGASQGQALEDANPQQGERLFHSVGCIACHAPRIPADGPTPGRAPGAVSLDHVPAKYGQAGLAAFLFQPLEAHPAGRMPDMQLTRAESRALAAYLIPARDSWGSLVPDADLVAQGEQHHARLGCVQCHESEGEAPSAARPLTQLNPERGCLDPRDTATPRYGLAEEQIVALRAALRAVDTTPDDGQAIAEHLTALNCIACHERGETGGVHPALDGYFTSDEPELGNEAHIPPPLHETGAKLRDTWLREVLYEGASVRPYMHTRMPRFGAVALGDLAEKLLRHDTVEPYPLPLPDPGDEQRALRDGGRQLLGIRGLACISCHTFKGKQGPGFQGVDLLSSYERLTPDWFARFLIDPQRFRPGIVMPESWSGGVAAHQGILDGDTRQQLRALWHYASLGTSAADPEGISRKPTRLELGDRTRVYRGRSRVAGFRGIAIGFPGGLCYAIDAETGALAALWNGDFVSVNWSGQGAGDFNPSVRAIELGHALAFHWLADPADPWPLLPLMDKENPVNPDPDYPRNLDFHFHGYRLDGDGTPTFEYSSGEVRITDRSVPVEGAAQPTLRRTLTLDARCEESLWLRVIEGELEESAARTFERPGLRVVVPDLPHELRTFQTRASTPEESRTLSELLLRIDLSAGPTTITIDHVLLP